MLLLCEINEILSLKFLNFVLSLYIIEFVKKNIEIIMFILLVRQVFNLSILVTGMPLSEVKCIYKFVVVFSKNKTLFLPYQQVAKPPYILHIYEKKSL
jgi:hypothetical protein